ncbi:DUF971 family protein [Arboricoccus pini]|uniref:DUF971 family protein n=1 Tax=Arboricoccus pini TaxID=1963835 RepID=A0A212QU89_9PROT|nr:DUF971 domain-containing protein [Arboricoccus pini]SNB63229.1 DUF971 family protein [Arboricoccus pini]
MPDPWPRDIKVHRAERALEIVFDDGESFSLPAELLRVESPSAEVQGHGPGEKRLVPGKRMVGIAQIQPVGNYAIRIVFDDGHDTGLYTWAYLHKLGRDQQALWRAYLDGMAQAGLTRD